MHHKEETRPTIAEISLDALASNLRAIRQKTGPGVRVMAVVKANAYGHGIREAARCFDAAGADAFGVSTAGEAVELRSCGITKPVLNLVNILPEEAGTVVRHGISQTVSDVASARSLARAALEAGRTARVHIKIDTGMGRSGVWHEEALELVSEIRRINGLEIEGISTHFPSADEEDVSFTMKQVRLFGRLAGEVKSAGLGSVTCHAANSAAAMRICESHFDMVRVGLALYGIYPAPHLKGHIELKAALTLKSRIVQVKNVIAGRSVSYGRTHTVKNDTRLGVVPAGYSDGYSRSLSNKAEVLVRGKRARVAGMICMDQFMVDVGGIPGVTAGEEVVLIGQQGGEQIGASELAALSGTITYEVVSRLSERIRRVFV